MSPKMPDKWYHVMFFADRGGPAKIYVNGERWYFWRGRRIWPIVPWLRMSRMWYWLWRHGLPWRLIPRKYRELQG